MYAVNIMVYKKLIQLLSAVSVMCNKCKHWNWKKETWKDKRYPVIEGLPGNQEQECTSLAALP